MVINTKSRLVIIGIFLAIFAFSQFQIVYASENISLCSLPLAHGQIDCKIYGPAESIPQSTIQYELSFSLKQNSASLAQIEWVSIKFFRVELVHSPTSALLYFQDVIDNETVIPDWEQSYTVEGVPNDPGMIIFNTYYLLEIKYEGQEPISETGGPDFISTYIRSSSDEDLGTSYDELEIAYHDLVITHHFLELSYDSLKSQHDSLLSFFYLFVILTIVFLVSTLYLAYKKRAVAPP